MATGPRYVIPGSERAPLPGAKAVGDVLPSERIEVSVRLRAPAASRGLGDGGALDDRLPAQRQYLSREEYASGHGADAADVGKVAAFAAAHQLVVVESAPARRTVVLSGTAAAMSAAFAVTLHQFEHDGGTYRGRTGPISVPADLAGIVEGVFGLDNRPQATSHLRSPRHTGRGRRPCRRGRVVHAAAAGRAVPVPGRPRRQRAVHRHHRAGRRLQAGGPQDLLRQPEARRSQWSRRSASTARPITRPTPTAPTAR